MRKDRIKANETLEARAERLAAVFAALSNPHRLRLFMTLASCCATESACDTDDDSCRCVGDLTEGLGIAASTVSHHLKELRRAGLIKTRRRGRLVECWIDPKVLDDLAAFFARSTDR